MIAIKKKNGISFRLATKYDIDDIVTLEKYVWGKEGADRKKIYSRISIFPDGNIIAIYQERIVGYVSFQYVDDITNDLNLSWNDITDNGKIVDSHKTDGKYIFGINISVHGSVSGKNLGTLLIFQVGANLILNNKIGVFLGSRIPGFKSYKKSNPDISADDYVKLRRNGQLRDPELRMYNKEGLMPVKIIPNYFPDEASLNYGVLLYYRNKFYKWPFKRIFNWLFLKIVLMSVKDRNVN